MQPPKTDKPLGHKAYGSIAHLPGSRLGPGDYKLNEGQFKILCVRPRDKFDTIIVREKLDGSNCTVARIGEELVPLGRAGYRAISSPYEQHRLFHNWVIENESFFSFLSDGDRVAGEWLAQAHGTRYDLPHAPFVVFDLFHGQSRALDEELTDHCTRAGLVMPHLLHKGGPLSIDKAMHLLEGDPGDRRNGFHGAIDPVEGAVWRVERKGTVDFLGKYVRPDKIDGKYLPELTGHEAIWNWRPAKRR